MIDTKKSPALKLAKLPDRNPVKMTITLSAELAAKLTAYATAYRETYGEAESVAGLVPFMIAAFIDADKNFAKFLLGSSAEASRNRGNSAARRLSRAPG